MTRIAVLFAALLTATTSFAGSLADGSCKIAIDRTMGMIDGFMLGSRDTGEIDRLTFSNKDGIGGALFMILLQLRTDPVFKKMQENDRRRVAYNICMSVYAPYFAISRPGQ